MGTFSKTINFGELKLDSDLVVVTVGDGVGCDSSLLHLQHDSDGEDGLTVLTAQLHQDPVTNLNHTLDNCQLFLDWSVRS